ncbi:MAG: hypothetical protein IJJ26_01990 [Victivallales bacterium]|nr:hypothetical protein [Victivallales bacterium]
MVWVWMAVSLGAALLTELGLGCCNVALPFVLLACFYHFCVWGWRKPFLLCFATCILLDLAFGRSIPATAFALLLSLPLAFYWHTYGNQRDAALQAIPGFVLGLLALAAFWLVHTHHASQNLSSVHLPWQHVVTLGLVPIVLMPLLQALLDRCARTMGMPRYSRQSADRGDNAER